MSILKVEHLKKAFEGVTPIRDVSFEVEKGDVISVIGPSGTGKSTLLRCLNLLETPTAGRVYLDGECISERGYDIARARLRMGMVFQSFNLFANLNILENVMAAPVDLLKVPRQQAAEEGLEYLRAVGLGDKAFNYPDELSGGQKQRAAIARTLAVKPEIILFDEPTSALDPTMVREVLNVIKGLAARGMTMMIVTHEMNFARSASTRIFYMDEGCVYEEGTPEEIFENPKREKTRIFIKKLRTMEVVAAPGRFDFPASDARLEEFARRNSVPPAIIGKMHLVFEELVMAKVYAGLEEGETARFAAECGEDGAQVILRLEAPERLLGFLEDSEDLSGMLVRGVSQGTDLEGGKLAIRL